ncbi:putative membrane-associated kinase regulator 4 [Iris pallida]|uniref:Membrane-associated kinase regulator 4 n=1 Tax=Iris pallida TaxID=29817 RepID=A0AAX6G1Y9_IRIPA|nr:putative membrane-associated kinase regulator 4 [Iris pallida]
MARTPPPPPRTYEAIVEEEYIDMDVSSATLVWYSVPSPPRSRDFEFQMSSATKSTLPGMDGITSPADELFYKGKLLPLHLPPRLQLVQKLLQDSAPSTHFASATATAAATPYESCNVSPATSCYVSGELNSEEDYYLDDEDDGRGREELVQLRSTSTRKSWTKKLKQSSLSIKLKASKAYIKSLFTKSGCSEEPRAVPTRANKKSTSSSGDAKRASGALRTRVDAEKMVVEEGCGHRRSFSGAIKRRVAPNNKKSSSSSSTSTTSCSSSSNSSSFSSVNSTSGLYGPQALKRSSSVNSEVECSVQGAIAYCKKSQQEVVCSRKSVSDVEFYALSASRIAADCEKQERPEICRG